MTPLPQIFDRKDVIEVIRNACLSGRGESGVLICSHKSGKSFLLRHIYDNLGAPDLIFCWMNLDILRAEQDAQSGTADQTFLRYLLRQLISELERRIDSSDEAQQIEELTRQHAEVPAEEAARRAFLMDNIAALRRQTEALDKLMRRAETIMAQGKVAIADVASLLERLKRGNKRLVLLIDDFHQIVKDPALVDVFRLLRGASGEGTITTIASSPVSLMDTSLHRGDPARVEERIALFNHFKAQVVRPFRAAEVDQFLDWLSDGEPLNPSEKLYLHELCGGSPYFLRHARQEFVQAGKPLDAGPRMDFERELGRNLGGALRAIFVRCSPERRAVLVDIAKQRAVDRNLLELRDLLDDGYVKEISGGYQISSRLLAEFVANQYATGRLAQLSVSVQAPYSVFPTALSYVDPSEPVITFEISNPTSERVSIELSCEIVGFAYPNTKIVSLEAEENRLVPMALLPMEDAVRALRVAKKAALRYRAEIETPSGKRALLADTQFVTVMPIDYFRFARVDVSRNVLLDSTWLIAAWVTSADDAVDKIKDAARALNGGRLEGYDSPDVTETVKALYDALKEHGWDYDSNALVFHNRDQDFVQRVRRPGRLLDRKAGNCLEGCVLFASLLAASDLHPVILFLPGHAVVGWKDRDSVAAEWKFLETTSMRTDSFEGACRKGQQRYEDRKRQCDAWLEQKTGEIHDPSDFAIPADISAILRARKPGQLPSEA
jgi:hypothetical protein